MSKRSDRIKEVQIQIAISILAESGMDDWQSFQAMKASYDFRDEEEHARLSMLRMVIFEVAKKFTASETPNNLNSLLNQAERLRIVKTLND